jgi:hypothetical protein
MGGPVPNLLWREVVEKETLGPTVPRGGPWTPTSHRERPHVPDPPSIKGKWMVELWNWTPTVRGQLESDWTDLPASGSNQSVLFCLSLNYFDTTTISVLYL